MLCKQCRKQNLEGAKHCLWCNAYLYQGSSLVPPPPPAPEEPSVPPPPIAEVQPWVPAREMAASAPHPAAQQLTSVLSPASTVHSGNLIEGWVAYGSWLINRMAFLLLQNGEDGNNDDDELVRAQKAMVRKCVIAAIIGFVLFMVLQIVNVIIQA